MRYQKLNRKLHIYTGLFFLLFIVLFAFSGLMLNHRWAIWEYWSNRQVTSQDIVITVPTEGSDLEKARVILEQMEINGEIRLLLHHVEEERLEIKTKQPGRETTVNVQLKSGQGNAEITEFSGWELMPTLHTFSGLHSNLTEKKNWGWTKVWSLFMDLTVGAMLVLAVSGLYMFGL